MPIGIGLHVLIAIYFAAHVIRTGQDKYWLWILFAFPFLGSVVYGIMIWLPDARNSRQGRQVMSGVQRLLDPSKELRLAQEALDVTATPDNRLRLADALRNAGRASEAIVQYHAVLVGIYAKDAKIRVHLAAALLDAGKPADAREELERLIAEQPNFKSPEGHLIYARAVAATGDRPKAREEFEALVGYYAGLEARARYAEVLLDWGDRARCQMLVDESMKIAKRMPGAARDINREWLSILKKVEDRLG
jgi:hypothetical protein